MPMPTPQPNYSSMPPPQTSPQPNYGPMPVPATYNSTMPPPQPSIYNSSLPPPQPSPQAKARQDLQLTAAICAADGAAAGLADRMQYEQAPLPPLRPPSNSGCLPALPNGIGPLTKWDTTRPVNAQPVQYQPGTPLAGDYKWPSGPMAGEVGRPRVLSQQGGMEARPRTFSQQSVHTRPRVMSQASVGRPRVLSQQGIEQFATVLRAQAPGQNFQAMPTVGEIQAMTQEPEPYHRKATFDDSACHALR